MNRCAQLLDVLGPDLASLVTGYTLPALGALGHLAEAWQQADDNNRWRITAALAPLLMTLKTRTSQPLAWFVLARRLGVPAVADFARQLDAAALQLPGFYMSELERARCDAPANIGAHLCCGVSSQHTTPDKLRWHVARSLACSEDAYAWDALVKP